MKIESVDIDSIAPDPANVRTHSERNLDVIKGSLARFGQQTPLVVDGDGIIRKGNGTYAAAVALGWKKINVVRTTLKGAEAIAYAIADNRSGDPEVGSLWDNAALAETLEALKLDESIDELVTGFDAGEIAAILAGDGDGEDARSPDGEPQEIAEKFEVVVECATETEQRRVFEELTQRGLVCRVLTI